MKKLINYVLREIYQFNFIRQNFDYFFPLAYIYFYVSVYIKSLISYCSAFGIS